MLKKFISYGLLKRNITCLKLKKEKNGFSAPRLRGLASLAQYSDLVVLCSPRHGSEESFAINKLCLAMRKPWLNVELNEYEAVIGPVAIKGKGPCYQCFDTRCKEGDFKPYEYLLRREASCSCQEQFRLMESASELAAEVSYALLRGRSLSRYLNKIFTVSSAQGGLRRHHLLPKDNCPVCADDGIPRVLHKGYGVPQTAFITLKNKKVVYRENGLRIISPRQTLKRIRPLTGRFSIINLYATKRRDRIMILAADPMSNNVRRAAAGKGSSKLQMQASAAMEAIERYCSKMHPRDEVITASFRRVREVAKDPRDFCLSRNFPVRFTPDLVIDWVWGYSLLRNQPVLVPANLAYCCYRAAGAASAIDYFWNSSGLGCGNCLEEAVLHAMLELVERDAYYTIYQNGLCMPDIDPASFRGKSVEEMLGRIKDLKISYYLKSYTTDIGLPTVATYLCGRQGRHQAHAFAVCTHLDPEIALLRSMTEALQLYPRFEHTSLWLKTSRTEHLYEKGRRLLSRQDFRNLVSPDLKKNIDTCLRLLKKLKTDVIVVNFTRPSVGIPVVKVLIDALQPFYVPAFPRYSERMFTVPKLLGFRKVRSSERDLANGVMCGMAEGMKASYSKR